jgi:hypothetical protein
LSEAIGHKAKKRKRRIKPPNDVSYWIFEAAANSIGISMLGWFPPERQRPAQKIAAKLRRGPWSGGKK